VFAARPCAAERLRIGEAGYEQSLAFMHEAPVRQEQRHVFLERASVGPVGSERPRYGVRRRTSADVDGALIVRQLQNFGK
jgi:hypothetical protein